MERSVEYMDYLSSKRWQEVRARLLDLAQNRCESCGAASCDLQVHHWNYQRLGAEANEDLEVLCVTCHMRADDLRRQVEEPVSVSRWTILVGCPLDNFYDCTPTIDAWIRHNPYQDGEQEKRRIAREAFSVYTRTGFPADLAQSRVWYDPWADWYAFLFKESNNGTTYIVTDGLMHHATFAGGSAAWDAPKQVSVRSTVKSGRIVEIFPMAVRA